MMASERQIAANRRNARKSTGPRSGAGKQRVRQNAFRHGLSLPVTTMIGSQKIELLARKIAGPAVDQITLSFARAAAEAEIDLVRIRQTKVALIKDPVEFGIIEETLSENTPKPFLPRADSLAAISSQGRERIGEALRRSLPALLKLARYEQRAALRRDRALQQLTKWLSR